MKYFVYYSYDYDEVGISEFDSKEIALKFITQRLATPSAICTLGSFTLIEGRKLALKVVEQVTRVTA